MEHAKSIMSALTTMQDSLLARKVSPGGPPVVLALFRPAALHLCLAGFFIRAHCSPASCRPLIPDTTMCFLMFASFLMRAWTGGLLDHAVYKDDRISGWRLINSFFCAEILDTFRPKIPNP